MNDQSIFDKAAVIAVSVLLILTAWNNATVMFIVAAIGLAAMMIILLCLNMFCSLQDLHVVSPDNHWTINPIGALGAAKSLVRGP